MKSTIVSRLNPIKQSLPAAAVQFRAYENGPNTSFKHAVIQLDGHAVGNFVSARAARGILGYDIVQHDERDRKQQAKILGHQYIVTGNIVLEWRLDKSSEKHKIVCCVVEDNAAPFDIVAGSQYIHDKGLASYLACPKPRKHKRRKFTPKT